MSEYKLAHPITDEQAVILHLDALQFVLNLHARFDPRRQALLQTRKDLQAEWDSGSLPGSSEETKWIRDDPDWKCADPAPRLSDRRVELTGTCDAKMLIDASNSGAKGYLADLEDNHPPLWQKTIAAQINLHQATRRKLSYKDTRGNIVSINPTETAAVVHLRPRGLHMDDPGFLISGRPASASLLDFGLYFYHNAKELIHNGVGPYFYLAKLEHHLEARWWNDVFVYSEQALAIPPGSIRATVMIETFPAIFHVEEILYQLKDHCAGLIASRWDYVFSLIKTLRKHPDWVMPDKAALATQPGFLIAQMMTVLRVCHKRNVIAMGNMSSQLPIGDESELNSIREAIHRDKVWDARQGYDGTWLAAPAFVSIALEAYASIVPGDNKRSRMRDDIRYTDSDLLCTRFPGETTEEGVSQAAFYALKYIANWLDGTGLVSIKGFTEDAAAAELARSMLWQWVHYGTIATSGRKITAEYVEGVLQQEALAVKGQQPELQAQTDVAVAYVMQVVCQDLIDSHLTIDLVPQLESFAADKIAKASAFNSTPKQFWVIGYPIAQSKSPMIHNTGYSVTGLPHRYSIHEIPQLNEDIPGMLNDPHFGGAAITMPFKVPIMRYLQDLTPAAKVLGAVNTVIPTTDARGKPILLGDNTDWLGIYNVLLKGLRAEHKLAPDSTGIVIGAGGAARGGIYALRQLGIKHVYVFNRTRSKVDDLIADFRDYDVTIIEVHSLDALVYTRGPPIFVIGTVPAKGTVLPGTLAEDGSVVLSHDIFSRPEGGVMLDMAYLPKRTPLIQVAEQAQGWGVNPGIMVLLQQAYAQFKIWTGVTPPEAAMAKATLEQYEKDVSG